MAYDQLKLENQLCFRLYTAARQVTNVYTPYFKALGITYAQYLVLMVLWEKDNRIVSDITSILHLETNTITPLLQRMEKQGLIKRQKGLEDSRKRIVSLTEKGKLMEEQIKDIPGCLAKQVIEGGISPEELLQLAQLLDKFTAATEKHHE